MRRTLCRALGHALGRARAPRGTSALRREDGSMSVEMVVLGPILLMVVLVAVAGGRYVSAEGMTQAAARDAARAASMERSAPAARAAANEALASAQTAGASEATHVAAAEELGQVTHLVGEIGRAHV